MKIKTLIGVAASLAILLGILIVVVSNRAGGFLSPATLTPSSTETGTPSPSETVTTTGTVTLTPTLFYAGDLGWGRVNGKVTDSLSGAPIPGALVTCSHFSYFPRSLCNGQALTASDGTFAFGAIFFHDTDTITLQVSAPGYASQTIHSTSFIAPEMTVSVLLIQLTSTDSATPTGTPTAFVVCTPPPCAIGTSEAYTCRSGNCPGGCGTGCATYTSTP
jgi:hypothetical protein